MHPPLLLSHQLPQPLRTTNIPHLVPSPAFRQSLKRRLRDRRSSRVHDRGRRSRRRLERRTPMVRRRRRIRVGRGRREEEITARLEPV